MRRVLLFLISVFAFTGLIKAQDDCMAFFPKNVGDALINKSYDANNNLLNTMTYRVNTAYDDFITGKDLEVGFVMTDASNNVIDEGNLDAECNDGVFYLKMVNRTISPQIMGILGEDTELVGDFLDYPDTFSDFPFEGNFKMDAGEFTIQSKSDKKELIRVRVYNREYEKNEKVTTPAGTFDASKITFDFDVYKDKKTVTYSGVEWYAAEAGIVRSETYSNKLLQNYTVLTSLIKK